MYTIKQASARSGVAIPTIRAWERRYGVVRPARTPSGYRLYDEDAIQRLVAMRRLLDDGWRPSLAAVEIAAHGVGGTGAATAPDVAGERNGLAVAGDSGNARGTDLADRFVEAAAAMDEASLERVLDDALARGSFERVARDQLFPALRALGDAWAVGRVSVAGEHLASHGVLRRLGLALDSAGRAEPDDRPVLVGLPPGARHELGALAFAVALRRVGVPVAYLGADLPLDDWVRAAAGASAAVIGVVSPRDRAGARGVVKRLRSAAPDLPIAVGGAASHGLDTEAVIVLPDDIEAAVRVVRQTLRERAAR
jgi:methanogenic corrinoid protein MtbC1